MKILAVTPWTPDATRTRASGLIRLLAEDHEVDLVHAAWEPHDDAGASPLGVRDRIPVRLSRLRGALRALAAIPSKRPMQIAFLDAPELRRAVQERWSTGSYDLLYLNVFRTLHLASIAPRARTIADLDELRSEYWSAVASRSSNPVRRIVGALEAPRMRRWERAATERFARVLFSNAADAAGSARASLVRSPHGLESRSRPGGRRSDSLVFVGRLGYAANEEALLWFVRRVLPRIRASHPAVRLDVVGRGASPRLRRELARHGAAVRFHGEVERVEPYYDAAAVSVVPVRLATGVQLKLLESFARGTPVVATPRVATLADVAEDVHCLVADTEQEWTDAVIRVLDDPELGDALAANASRWLADFSESAVREQLRSALSAAEEVVRDPATSA